MLQLLKVITAVWEPKVGSCRLIYPSFSNGLGINVMASISDATTYITKGADYLTPWEDRKLGTTYSTGRRYGDIYGLWQIDCFKRGLCLRRRRTNRKITVIYNGTAHTTNKQSSPYPVYQVHYEDNNKLILHRVTLNSWIWTETVISRREQVRMVIPVTRLWLAILLLAMSIASVWERIIRGLIFNLLPRHRQASDLG